MVVQALAMLKAFRVHSEAAKDCCEPSAADSEFTPPSTATVPAAVLPLILKAWWRDFKRKSRSEKVSIWIEWHIYCCATSWLIVLSDAC